MGADELGYFSDREKEVLRLRILEKMKQVDVAKQLQLAQNTISTHEVHGKRKIKDIEEDLSLLEELGILKEMVKKLGYRKA